VYDLFQEDAKHRMHALNWDSTEDIAIALYEKFPTQDPLQVRFTDLHKWITDLQGFADDPAKIERGEARAIQMAWYERVERRPGIMLDL